MIAGFAGVLAAFAMLAVFAVDFFVLGTGCLLT